MAGFALQDPIVIYNVIEPKLKQIFNRCPTTNGFTE